MAVLINFVTDEILKWSPEREREREKASLASSTLKIRRIAESRVIVLLTKLVVFSTVACC